MRPIGGAKIYRFLSIGFVTWSVAICEEELASARTSQHAANTSADTSPKIVCLTGLELPGTESPAQMCLYVLTGPDVWIAWLLLLDVVALFGLE